MAELDRYSEGPDKDRGVAIIKIVVPTQYDKDQLLAAIRYIHNLREIDSDYCAVNTLMHLYHVPELIEVHGQ